MATIRLTNVQKSYGDHPPVIRRVNLDIAQHEFCVFLGPSGCGKSTLLRMIAGLEDLSEGELHIGGRLMNDVPSAKRGVAMVFQSYALFPHMTVFDNMAFGLKLAKQPKDVIESKVREAARILQLEDFLQRYPKALSGGQRQRVAIGRAIVREPGVFLFDEPLSNLDAALRGQTRVEIARLHQRFANASVVYVTHDQVEAMTLADRIVLLHAGADAERFGSIAQTGAPLELYHHPKSRFVAGFIGSPRMNFVDAVVDSIEPGRVALTLAQGGERLSVHVDGQRLQRGQAVTLGVRPEHLRLDGDGQFIQCVTVLSERLGEHSYIHADHAAGSLVAKAPGDTPIESGERIRIHVSPSACHLFDADGVALRRSTFEPERVAA
ncbi:ABC transporter ATP-binding protein [Paraburkholderia sp. DD10]|uniref:Carbohydrate ABC transporter ATP-binding protein, CUT1 family n=1 Tax=Paraburkholderia terricola TaxID=169427 RepID=A0A1M6N546_9BURK|nr:MULTISPECIES: sn-glycerol-3-phosphate ABC transporter ATP-binding protein UgpC [Paraburkholderia]ORC51698.1 ABC transporter [Burkholderia sp. A27]SDO73519.1 carbohydrate ABC transporter ATP-binding protein, CUT1 family [Paraburkholderia sediminicola]SHJ90821.1 carbohydrate ABC transporter ATP-binding protein, CUT1 family [Paraburkholderia terricola]